MNKTNSLYIHIPFCKSKCHYCNFISFTGKDVFMESYFQALEKELDFYLSKSDFVFESIYIGGGTPSVADIKYYQDLFEKINSLSKLTADAEITMELNPDSVSFEYLKGLKSIGVNRLSIGVQSFDDEILKAINRIHTSKQAITTINNAKQAGFNNISIDLIYGLPSQSFESWTESVLQGIALDVQHISAYGLKIEENTFFAKQSNLDIPDEDMQSKMYLETIKLFENNKFNHYEISNFSKMGCESRHNLCYWKNNEYLGCGLNSHGFLNGIRYSNTSDFDAYLENPLIRETEHFVSSQESIEEGVFLGLRLTKGINVLEFEKIYNVDLISKYKKVINKYIELGLMELKNNTLKLNNQGILMSNFILAEFLE